MNNQYKLDLVFGEKSEKNTLESLKLLLNDDSLKHYNNKYSILDFCSEKYNLICEVKGRRISSRQYPTTMIGCNKIKFAHKMFKKGYTILFFFDFTDGLFFFNYEDFHSISEHKLYNEKMGGTFKRGLKEMKMHCYIPICRLTKVQKYRWGAIDYMRTYKYKGLPDNVRNIIENFIVCKN
jgi:hypothetical protein